jgi:hypothetical protein
VAADEGEDFEEILQQLEEEQKLAEKYGVKLISTERPASAQTAADTATNAGAGQGADG